MVASSVVSTILILNYHHRNADTHEMSPWVSLRLSNVFSFVSCEISILKVDFVTFKLTLYQNSITTVLNICDGY